MAQDPICGMQVNEKSSLKLTRGDKEYFFCSTHCREKFIKEEGIECVASSCQAGGRLPFYKNKLFLVSSAPFLLILASLFFPHLVPFRNAFLAYLKTIWWAIILGFLLGGIIDYYVPREYISKILSRRKPSTIFNAVFLGFLMSACSHGILALSMQLHKKGASGPAVVSFLLASPWANFTITIMLFAFFGLKSLFIILAALLVAINTGFIYMFLEKKGFVETNKNIVEVAEGFSIAQDIRKRMKNYTLSVKTLASDCLGVIKGALALAELVLWWLVLGMFIASLVGAYIPVHFFHKFMGPTLLGLFVTLALATIIEVCSEGSSPLAFEIYKQTGAFGNSFTFLMAGVATDYTEIGLLWSNLGRRTALLLPIITVPQIIVIGYIANLIFI
ncbi:MAG: permease [Candidatus Omnitrophica bacterium]|nr:permease [Candidatus Omnitrophota bacterium]